ncbi:YVTN family beta-propeller protein [Deinococcus metalli]|uniref:YVTN family beta-propeller protein n=1 Tax=Deinococcus metalli TaxID=1141878 RepID=A0A7W8NPZ0_9DEIO|nr:hypothetical protein [Deinococcus metalli]MBB5376280.1 YVTN family beta-propeller protein [Deinococcus metalli]GHF39498.1 hypothetical protein GCM10017781_15030 [Deinococcus metalli]
MAGLDPHVGACPDVQDELERRAQTGAALSVAAHEHLRTCAACRAHDALLRDLEFALLEDVPAASPPPALRTRVLAAARNTPPARRWWPAALGAAAVVVGVLTLGSLLSRSQGVAAALPDPAVVVSVDGPLVIASNDHAGTISVVQGGRVTASVPSGGAQTAWFTEGVRLGGHVFLADAANDRVLEVRTSPLGIVRTYPVPEGVAGLTASSTADGGHVYFKSVRGQVGTLDGARVTIATAPGMPLADVMDGVLLLNGTLYVTHHLSGDLCLLDPDTLAVRARVSLGGMPVALAPVRGGLLALDVTGRLLRLDLAGQITRTWTVTGHPDKLTVNGDSALLSDRGGMVTRIDLRSGQVTQVKVTHPMDVTTLPDGTYAVAEGGRGLRVLDARLQTTGTVEHPAERRD